MTYKRSSLPGYERSLKGHGDISKQLIEYFEIFDRLIVDYPKTCKQEKINIHHIGKDAAGWNYCTSYLEQNRHQCLRLIFFIHQEAKLIVFCKVIADHDYGKMERKIYDHYKAILRQVLIQEGFIKQ